MNKDNQSNQIFRWEMWGILFIVLLGGFLHFAFEISGNWRPLGAVAAVNESVWEHLKLVFWPALFWTLIEFVFPSSKSRVYPNFVLARAISAFIMPIVIVIIFYTYTTFTGKPILVVDLTSFVLAVLVGQIISYYLMKTLNLARGFNFLGCFLWLVGIMLFIWFTFSPPHLGIFQDGPTGGFGILQ